MSSSLLGSDTPSQIGFVVRDIEAAVRRYVALLGLPAPAIVESAPYETARTEYRGAPTPARARLAFFPLGSLTLELIQPDAHPSIWKEHLDQCGEGVHHLAFQIRDMSATLPRLAAQGLPLLQRGEFSGGRYAYLDGRPALGVLIELLEIDG